MAGNLSTVSAAIADTHEGRERAKGMGHMGAAIGLGFVFGPAIGGALAGWSRGIDWGGATAFGLNPFSGCALAALALSLVNLLVAWRRFPETLPPEGRGEAATERTLNPLGALRHLDAPGVARTNLAYFLFFGAFGAMEFTLTFLAVERLGFSEAQNAWMFVYVGLLIAFVQGGLVRRLAPRYGERPLASAGIALTLPGFVVVGVAQGTGTLYLGLGLLSVGSAFVMPCLSALVSRYSPPDRQGLALGVFRSLGSLARAIGPLVGGLLYWKLGSWGPYHVGAVLCLLPLALALRLPPVPEHEPRPAAPTG
jgi:MFS family permease